MKTKNYLNRTKEDICLLCLRRKADATGSHFTPMALIKSNTGKRNYEETYSIRPDGKVETFWGRNNLTNSNTEINEDPHSADHVFCSSCENLLGRMLESPMTKILNEELRNPNKSQMFPAKKYSLNVYYKELTNVSTPQFNLFVYSIIWRQCIQQKIKGGERYVLAPEKEEELRKTIYFGLYPDIENQQQDIASFSFSIITAGNFKDSTLHHVSPHFRKNNPEVFCINEYLIFLYTDNSEINDDFFALPKDVFSKDLLNNGDGHIKIIFIKDDEFENFQKLTWKESAKAKFRNKIIDDFKHSYYLRYKSPIDDEYFFQVNDEINAFMLDEIKKLLLQNPLENVHFP